MDIKQVMEGQSQNLANPTRVSNSESPWKHAKLYKALALNVLGILAAFFVGYSYFNYLAGDTSLWIVLTAGLVFVSFSALHVLLQKNMGEHVLVIAFETIAILFPFYAFDLRMLGILGAAVFLLFFWGYADSRSELNYGTQIRFFKVTHQAVGKFVTAVLIFGICFYALARVAGGDVFMSEHTFSGFFDWSGGMFNDFYPAIVVNGSFSDFANSIVAKEASNIPGFESQSSAGQATIIAQGAAQFTANFSKSADVAITSSSTTSGVVYDVIVNNLRSLEKKFPEGFLIAWGIAVFLILRSIGILFGWVAEFFSMIFYEILLAAKFMRITTRPETKELIEL